MDPFDTIRTLQQLIKDNEAHLQKLIKENADLRALTAIPRDIQQEANLTAMQNAEGFLKTRCDQLEELNRKQAEALKNALASAEALRQESHARSVELGELYADYRRLMNRGFWARVLNRSAE